MFVSQLISGKDICDKNALKRLRCPELWTICDTQDACVPVDINAIRKETRKRLEIGRFGFFGYFCKLK